MKRQTKHRKKFKKENHKRRVNILTFWGVPGCDGQGEGGGLQTTRVYKAKVTDSRKKNLDNFDIGFYLIFSPLPLRP